MSDNRGRGRGIGAGRGAPNPRGRGDHFQVSFASRAGPVNEVFSHGEAKIDRRVQEIENETAKAVKLVKPEPMMPLRPGYGSQGQQVTLRSNYFQVEAPKDLQLFRYHVEIAPVNGKAPIGKKAGRVIALLIQDHFAAHKNTIATDYKANLISKTKLPPLKLEYIVPYRAEDEDEPREGATEYRLRVQSTGILSASDLLDYLTSSNVSQTLGSKEDLIQALNIIMSHHPKSSALAFSVGANKHFLLAPHPSETMSLIGGLRIFRGFFMSVRPATGRLLLNVQVKHVACYEEGPLASLMQMYQSHNGSGLSGLARFVKKLRVSLSHLSRTNSTGKKTTRIKQITGGLAMPGDGQNVQHPPIVPFFGAGSRDVKFYEDRDAKEADGKKQEPPSGYVSVFDYFKRKYSIVIKNPKIPVINVGTRQNPSYLPADVCYVLPGQPSDTKLTPSQTKEMIKFAVRKPALNAKSIAMNSAEVLGTQSSTITDFGLAVDSKLVTVPGRVLMGPEIKYRGSSVRPVAASWNMRSNVKFSTTTKITTWTYLFFKSSRERGSSEAVAEKMTQLQSKLRSLGVDAPDFLSGLEISADSENIEKVVDSALERFMTNAKRSPPGLLIVVIPFSDNVIYNHVKYICDVKFGLLNVCALQSKFLGANEQYHANLALKINLKLGGRNQALDPKKLGIIAEGKTMVVGIDVTHPSPGSTSNAPSVAGIVASVDEFLGQWPADLQIQTGRQEMVSAVDIMMKSRLQLWANRHRGVYPENILIYRDGVSEGQYNLVLHQELPLIRKACRELYPAASKPPRISIIVVGKRHHTRFYPTTTETSDRSNTKSGTVVDRGVTEARNWDFFLQAHSALQGTARPAHYYIVLDEIFRSQKPKLPFVNAADTLEDLTHNMCYLFGRATKAVSICPAAYYADLVCERARCYFSKVFDGSSGGTPAASVTGNEAAIDSNDAKVHQSVRNSMFYI